MDTLGDLFTIIRNGYLANKEFVAIPHSRLKEEVVKKLRDIGYIAEYTTEKNEKMKKLKIKLKYDNGNAALSHIKRVSTPGLRVYSPRKKLRPVLGGMGHTLLSTSKGILTNREAIKKGMGGEILCEVW